MARGELRAHVSEGTGEPLTRFLISFDKNRTYMTDRSYFCFATNIDPQKNRSAYCLISLIDASEIIRKTLIGQPAGIF